MNFFFYFLRLYIKFLVSLFLNFGHSNDLNYPIQQRYFLFSISFLHTWKPIKPALPVTNIFINLNLTNASHFVKNVFYKNVACYFFYAGIKENSFLSVVIFIFPSKISILFFCKFIILKIFSVKGPDENL